MSTPAEYNERYWSEGGYRPVGSLHPVHQHLFEAYVSPSARCLDLGCGDGRTAGLWLSRHAAAYVGVDISQPAVDEARALGLNARRIDDAGTLPFGDGEFDVVVVASALEQDDMGDRAHLRSVVVPHAVMGISDVTRSPSNGDGLRVGFLGRLHPVKNPELLIDALALLPEYVTLHVAGDGPPAYRESLVSRAKSCGVARRIRWLGFVEDAGKREFLASIDVLAMPSAFDSFGIAAVEALSASVPVIVSPHVGVADVVLQYRCGRVTAATAPDIAHALGELTRDSSNRLQLSENARLAAREFSIGAHGERLKAEYNGAVVGRRGRSRT